MQIILNEKNYVEHILSKKTMEPSKTNSFLNLYARYLYHEKNLGKQSITQKLHTFMKEEYPRYHPADWTTKIETYTNRAQKYPLCQCSGVWITERELQTIEHIQNKVLERLAFTLLCLSKFRNFQNPENQNWIHYSNHQIYTMACINTTAFEKDSNFNKLKELGLIKYAKKINNLGIQILFADENSERTLLIKDFRKLGYEWRLYKGEKFVRCTICGLLVKDTNGRRKHCKDCAEQQNRQKVLQRYYLEKNKAL